MFRKKKKFAEEVDVLPKKPELPTYLYAQQKMDFQISQWAMPTYGIKAVENREELVPASGETIIGVYQLVEKQRVFRNTIVESIPLP